MKKVPIRVPHAIPPRSLNAQQPILLKISLGNVSGPTALFCACSINSILWSTFFYAWQLHNVYEHMQNNIYVNIINHYQIKNNLPFRKSLKPQEMDELRKRRYPEIVPLCVTSTQVVKQMP